TPLHGAGHGLFRFRDLGPDAPLSRPAADQPEQSASSGHLTLLLHRPRKQGTGLHPSHFVPGRIKHYCQMDRGTRSWTRDRHLICRVKHCERALPRWCEDIGCGRTRRNRSSLLPKRVSRNWLALSWIRCSPDSSGSGLCRVWTCTSSFSRRFAALCARASPFESRWATARSRTPTASRIAAPIGPNSSLSVISSPGTTRCSASILPACNSKSTSTTRRYWWPTAPIASL